VTVTTEEQYMHRCLDLARRGYGKVNPNPMVGSVIVKDDRVVGEGFHSIYGGEHAEIAALREAGDRASGATLYVNLEPCNHFGKTPPCIDAIKRAGIARVVYAVHDPNPMVTGHGRSALLEAGIDVTSDVLAPEATRLNDYFLFAMKTRYPFVLLKAAVTLDGYIADRNRRSRWITGEEARQYVQHIRRGVDAILVGANTVTRDNPRLTVHDERTRQPFRIVLDGKLSSPPDAKVYTDEFKDRTILITADSRRNAMAIKTFEKKGIRVLPMKAKRGFVTLRTILRTLWALSVTSVLVEGGGTVFNRLIEEKLYARGMFFIAPKFLGDGIPVFSGESRPIGRPYALEGVEVRQLGQDILVEGYSKFYKKRLRGG
jgi:diaminohydroxyphosphoribosylaminopyrimidine deaminase / 5-amino-6-(5-phosphoribosylamino)uracil reductase